MEKAFKKSLLAFLAAVLLCAASAAAVSADSADPGAYYENVDRMVTVQATDGSGYLYLRFGPGMGYDVMENIYDGTVLHISAICQDYDGIMWGQTQFEGRYGWVSMQHTVPYEAPENVSETAVDYYVAVQATDGSDYLYLRSGPSRGDMVLCNVYDGTKLHITSETQDAEGLIWGKTQYNDQTGWVSLKFTVPWENYESAQSEEPEAIAAQEEPQPVKETEAQAVTSEAEKEPEKEQSEEPVKEETEAPEKDTSDKSEEDSSEVTDMVDPTTDNIDEIADDSDNFNQKLMTAVIVVVVIVAAAAIILVILLKKNKR